MIRVIVFDFDGVIVDSNIMKRQTFFKIFENVEGADDILKKFLRETLHWFVIRLYALCS